MYFGQLDFFKRLSELAQTHLWLNGPPIVIVFGLTNLLAD